ncbi:MAG: hypothetical protein V1921_04540 [Candidatus Altiarchaeota archaeon]
MSYVCMECGSEEDYAKILSNKLKCSKCKEKRSNIWVKKRPTNVVKSIIAR